MLALYHCPFTRSHLIRFVLEELELPHELRRVNVPAGEHKAPAYLRLNPLGQLPTLLDDDLTLREAAAIALHLADKTPASGLSPELGSAARAPYYQWVVFSVASELTALAKLMGGDPAALSPARAEWATVADALTLGLHERSFLLGERFSIADAMVGGSLWLAQFLGVLSPYPRLLRYYQEVSSRPAFARAFADAVPA